jgi:hypothetical protein
MEQVPDQPVPSSARPGIATAAAVLGFVEAGLVLLWLLPTLVVGLGIEARMTPVEFLGAAGAAVLCGFLLLGGVHLLRGVGWRMLVGTTAVEIAGLLALVALAAAAGSWPDAGGSAVLVVLLTLPTVRLGLLLPRSVAAWVERQDPVPNRWLGPLVLAPVGVALVLAVLSV